MNLLLITATVAPYDMAAEPLHTTTRMTPLSTVYTFLYLLALQRLGIFLRPAKLNVLCPRRLACDELSQAVKGSRRRAQAVHVAPHGEPAIEFSSTTDENARHLLRIASRSLPNSFQLHLVPPKSHNRGTTYPPQAQHARPNKRPNSSMNNENRRVCPRHDLVQIP